MYYKVRPVRSLEYLDSLCFRDFVLDQMGQLRKLLIDLEPHLFPDQRLQEPRKTLHGKLPSPMQTCSSTVWLKIPGANPAWASLTMNDKAAIGLQLCQLRKHFSFPTSQVTQFSKLTTRSPGTWRQQFHLE